MKNEHHFLVIKTAMSNKRYRTHDKQ